MNKEFRVLVDDIYEFHLGHQDATDLDQLTFQEIDSRGTTEKIHVLHNKKSISAEVLTHDFIKRKYKIKINGNIYQVNIETPLDQLIEEMGLSLGNTSIEDEIHAPMPGIILEVGVSEGDEVRKGDFVCVLEAMKMENALLAPRDGTIKSVNIKVGETVDKGKLLIEFQKND